MWGLAGHGDVVGLHVEDETVRLVLGDCRRLEQLGGVHAEEAAEHSVHSSEGQGHAAGSAQEAATVHAEAVGLTLGASDDLLFQATLLRGLRDGQVLLVGNDLRGHRQVAVEPRVQTGLANPAIADLGLRTRRRSLRVGHIHPVEKRRIRRPKDYFHSTRFTNRSSCRCRPAKATWRLRGRPSALEFQTL